MRTNLSEVALDAGECCWRGISNMVEIRKNRKEESLRKKLCEGLQNAFVVQSYTSSLEKKGLNKLEFLFCSFKAVANGFN